MLSEDIETCSEKVSVWAFVSWPYWEKAMGRMSATSGKAGGLKEGEPPLTHGKKTPKGSE